jgi:hypothetical protein
MQYLIHEALTKLPKEAFNFKVLSSLPDLPLDIVLHYRNEEWDFKVLSKRKDLTIDLVVKLKDKPWCWDTLSSKFSLNDIFCHPDLSWVTSKMGDLDIDTLKLTLEVNGKATIITPSLFDMIADLNDQTKRRKRSVNGKGNK